MDGGGAHRCSSVVVVCPPHHLWWVLVDGGGAQDPRKSCQRVDTDSDRKFENEGARLDTNQTDF